MGILLLENELFILDHELIDSIKHLFTTVYYNMPASLLLEEAMVVYIQIHCLCWSMVFLVY